MDQPREQEQAPPQYDDDPPAPYDETPIYEASASASASAARRPSAPHELGTTLTIDPSGTSIVSLPLGNGSPAYTLSGSLLRVRTGMSLDISRPDAKTGKELAVYAIAEEFIFPLHAVPARFKNVLVRNSAGLFSKIGLKKVVWDFSTQSPIPTKGGKVDFQAGGGENGAYFVTMSGDVGVKNHLLQFYDGKWVDQHDEVLALAREGGAECKGMPVLGIVKDLDQEMMDFLVSSWCVTMWRDVGRRASHYKAK